jgi:peroxiredoxin (alkyl hydroperoxide reductase subunit C)
MTESTTLLAPGTLAPDFTLKDGTLADVSLADFRGRPVILVFYPADWSPVCTDQLGLYEQLLPEFTDLGDAVLLGISVDGAWSHAAYAEARNLTFPLLADFEPKGAVARAYGVYDPVVGWSGRALFVIDGDGIIQWSQQTPTSVNPGADGILTALEQLTGKQVVA